MREASIWRYDNHADEKGDDNELCEDCRCGSTILDGMQPCNTISSNIHGERVTISNSHNTAESTTNLNYALNSNANANNHADTSADIHSNWDCLF